MLWPPLVFHLNKIRRSIVLCPSPFKTTICFHDTRTHQTPILLIVEWAIHPQHSTPSSKSLVSLESNATHYRKSLVNLSMLFVSYFAPTGKYAMAKLDYPASNVGSALHIICHHCPAHYWIKHVYYVTLCCWVYGLSIILCSANVLWGVVC